jgi:hypothetical protein
MTTPLAKKLLIKPGARLALLSVPDTIAAAIGPADVVSTAAQIVVAAVHAKAEVSDHCKAAIAVLVPGGVLWLAYPKKSGAIKTDINRDAGWEPLTAMDWLPVSQIALDATWSALRFRPRSEIKQLTRQF